MKEQALSYEAPQIRVMMIQVEKGFAASADPDLDADQLPHWGEGTW